MAGGRIEYDHIVKVLLLGDTAVGKTSLLVQFCESKFEANFITSIGVDFKWKTFERDGRKLRLEIWDTAGQERFRTITPAYYRSAMGVVIVYDITDRKTFENVKFWVEQLGQHGAKDVQRILVGNKKDLSGSRKVTTEEGQKLASDFGIRFFEASAKDNDGVDDAFYNVTDAIVAQRFANVPPAGAAAGSGRRLESPGPAPKKKCGC